MQVGYVFDPFLANHKCLDENTHYECPERIYSIYKELLNQDLVNSMVLIQSRNATINEIELAHDSKYLNKLEKTFSYGEKTVRQNIKNRYNSVFANKYTLECAKLAAGSTVELVTNIIEKKIRSGIALVRPPGHHATKNEAMGFCIFNNVAIASLVARNMGKKVVVVDIDVHRGNGTQNILQNEKDIYFYSTHRYDNGDFYPGYDKYKAGNLVSVGFNGSITNDNFIKMYKDNIIQDIQKLSPDIIIVSAGFDAGINDPLGECNVTPKGFRKVIEMLQTITPNIALVLEGGYNLKTISNSMCECTKALLEYTSSIKFVGRKNIKRRYSI